MAATSQRSQPDPDAGPAERRVRDALVSELERAVAGVDAAPAAPAHPLATRDVPGPTPEPAASGRPIAFNAAMVRALLAGQKTQTRRPIRPLPTGEVNSSGTLWPVGRDGERLSCRLAGPGEHLWVREPWAAGPRGTEYEADVGPARAKSRTWKAGRFMARSASRLTLRVTRVSPERLTALSPAAAAAEGMPPGLFDEQADAPIVWFSRLWDQIYGRDPDLAWAANPWVWAIHFELIPKHIDALRGRD